MDVAEQRTMLAKSSEPCGHSTLCFVAQLDTSGSKDNHSLSLKEELRGLRLLPYLGASGASGKRLRADRQA